MKRLVGFIGILMVSVFVFAQKIPEGRDLFPLVWDCENDYEKLWTAAELDKIDVVNDEYVFSVYTISKVMVGYMRQSYNATIKGEGGKLSVKVTDMTTVACDKDGNITKGAKVSANPKSTMDKMASLLADELAKRITSWTDEEYEEKINVAVTNPIFLSYIKRETTDLYFKKFCETQNVIGRKFELSLEFDSIEESNKSGFAYKAQILSLLSTTNPFKTNGLKGPTKSVMAGNDKRMPCFFPDITVYSNNDSLIALKKDTPYKVSGVITDVGLSRSTSAVSLVIEE